MALIDELEARGLVSEVTNREELSKLLESGMVTLYAGYDPTASSLHVGNLVPTIMLKHFQVAGHKPLVLVGGATGMIGDPSGRSDERNQLDDETLQTNLAGIRGQLEKLLDFGDRPNSAVMTNNYDWMRGISFLEFLRDVGKYLTVNYMTAKESVRKRIESDSGISYTEFSYQLMQGYDFVHLAQAHGCRLQVGGSDQYGNITAGCELSRKMGKQQLFGLVAPLLLDASGQKMGKSASGERIWLDAARTTPFEFYRYWFNRPDEELPKLLKMFSLRPLAEIEDILRRHDADRAKRLGQTELARTMTSWIHGDDAVANVETGNRVMFGDSLEGLTDADLGRLDGIVPTVDVPRAELEAGVGIVDLLVRAKVADSKGAARRLVEQGGAYLNNAKVSDANRKITLADLATESMLVLRSGKKIHVIVRASA